VERNGFKKLSGLVAVAAIALVALPATAFGHGSMEKAQSICDLQEGLSDGTFTGAQVKLANKAIEYITDSLTAKRWDMKRPGGTVNVYYSDGTFCMSIFDSHNIVYKGNSWAAAIFGDEKKAVYQLKHIPCGTPAGELAWDVIDELFLIDYELAQNGIDDVDPFGPGPWEVNQGIWAGLPNPFSGQFNDYTTRPFKNNRTGGLKLLGTAKTFIPKAFSLYNPATMRCTALHPDHALDAFKHAWEKADDV
jgi:hypothetical protein